MRIAVHTDYEYRSLSGDVYGQHAFTLFIIALAAEMDGLVLLGRDDPSAEPRYPLGSRVKFVGLPHYPSLTSFRSSIRGMIAAVGHVWRVLDEVDGVWLLGPHPMQLGFAAAAVLRGKRVAIGVRQEFSRYIASRHPGRRGLHLLAHILEGAWRALARFVPVVVVGPELASQYRRSRHLLEITASLVSEDQIITPKRALQRSYAEELRILSVGRLSAEKNPLLLAEVLAHLRSADSRWRLTVVGEGPMSAELGDRLGELQLEDAVELKGYVPFGRQLEALYRESHMLLHVSRTEGMPQVLVEAFSAGLPTVATDVGGVREAVEDAAILIPPADAEAAADALDLLASDAELRARLIGRGIEFVERRTIELETRRVARFLSGQDVPAQPGQTAA